MKINGIYVVKNGQVQLIEPPQGGFGEQSFVYSKWKSNSYGRAKNSVNIIKFEFC
ncbi:hypothetical protein Btoyo_4715 [Bacillus toyonensis BCT-7112]|nr:hypothetical protein Btoyo_4715 [Bacillus toyonensis BCT-7112]